MQFSKVEELYSKTFSQDEMYDFRNDIHMHPELGGEEFRTVGKICEKLDEYGLKYDHIADTGVIVRIHGSRPGKTIALRADIDALPVDENTDFEFKSQTPGKHHACGHDIHTTILLGVAKMLAALKGDFAGNFTLLFQPAEESFGGAERMIAAGALENPHVDHVIGLHNNMDIPAGQVGVLYGGGYAGSISFRMTIHGKSAHAAHPHESIDPIVCAAQFITACQTVVSRNMDPTGCAVVTVGSIHGGTVSNQITDSVELKGTTRTLNREVGEMVINRVEALARTTCEGMGAALEFERIYGYRPLINDDATVDAVKAIMEDSIGKENVHVLKTPEMGCEDFAYFAEQRPSVFYQFGVMPTDGQPVYGLHNTRYNPNAKEAIPFGIKLQTAVALGLAGN